MQQNYSLNNIHGLIDALNITYDPNEWRLFIDPSKTSLKAVLLYWQCALHKKRLATLLVYGVHVFSAILLLNQRKYYHLYILSLV